MNHATAPIEKLIEVLEKERTPPPHLSRADVEAALKRGKVDATELLHGLREVFRLPDNDLVLG